MISREIAPRNFSNENFSKNAFQEILAAFCLIFVMGLFFEKRTPYGIRTRAQNRSRERNTQWLPRAK